MAGTKLIEKLAKSAAEKRAYGFMYGGMPYGGSYGGMMNPYLGGLGYGGRWGGDFGGFGGGYPMMAQSYATPYGRGGFYGMDPMGRQIYGLGAMQGLGQQQQMFEQAALPGAQIGLQGQQLGVEQQRQLDPALENTRKLEQATLSRDLADPTLADPRASTLIEQINAQRALAEERQKRYEQLQQNRRGITQRHTAELQGLNESLGKLTPNSAAYNQMLTAAVTDPSARELMVNLGFAKDTEDAVRIAKENTSGFGRAWRRNMPGFVQSGDTDWADAAKAFRKRRELTGYGQGDEAVAGAHSKELEAQQAEEAAARAAYEEAQRKHNELLAQQQQMQANQERILAERAQHGTQNLQNVRGRTAGTVAKSEGAALGGLTNPVTPGQAGPRPTASGGPTTTATPPPRPAPNLPTGTPVVNQAHKPTFTPPGGPQGPRGPIKVASLVELADQAARIHREHQVKKAGLGDLLGGQSYNVPGSQTRTGQGKRIIGSDALKAKMQAATAKPVMPAVAGAVQPRISSADAMKSLGLSHLPSSMAHLPVESAVSMGMTADQHAQLRKLLGLG